MDEQNVATGNSPRKSKKGLYIVVGVVVLIVIIYFFTRGTTVAPGVTMDRNLDGSATYKSNDGTTVSVGTNKLPDNWPSDAPSYNGAEIQYSGSSNPQTGTSGSYVVFLTSDSTEKISSFYKTELAAKGWTVEQTMNAGASTVISAKKDTRTFGLYIVDNTEGKRSVTIGISMQ